MMDEGECKVQNYVAKYLPFHKISRHRSDSFPNHLSDNHGIMFENFCSPLLIHIIAIGFY